SGNRLDAVFMEYIADMVGQGRHGQLGGSQVATQTAAELGEVGTWALRLAGYATLLTAAGLGWRLLFRRVVVPALCGWPKATAVALPAFVVVGAWGLHPDGPDSVQAAPIASSTFYALAQSPIWIVKSFVETASKPPSLPHVVQQLMPE